MPDLTREEHRAYVEAGYAPLNEYVQRNTHLLDRQEDEFFCSRCGKRWAVDEAAPTCA